jgi:hypothetical protein
MSGNAFCSCSLDVFSSIPVRETVRESSESGEVPAVRFPPPPPITIRDHFALISGGKITGKNLPGNCGCFGCFTFCHRQNDQLGWVEIELQLGELAA